MFREELFGENQYGNQMQSADKTGAHRAIKVTSAHGAIISNSFESYTKVENPGAIETDTASEIVYMTNRSTNGRAIAFDRGSGLTNTFVGNTTVTDSRGNATFTLDTLTSVLSAPIVQYRVGTISYKRSGVGKLNGRGVASISCTGILETDIVMLTSRDARGALRCDAINAGAGGFHVTSTDPLDSGHFNWLVIR